MKNAGVDTKNISKIAEEITKQCITSVHYTKNRFQDHQYQYRNL